MSGRSETTVGAAALSSAPARSGKTRSPTADPRVADLVQAGKIRLALFLPQYTKDPATGELRGVGTGFLAIELAGALAARLGLELVVIEHPTPAKAVECLKTSAGDVAFMGIEPSRAAEAGLLAPGFPI